MKKLGLTMHDTAHQILSITCDNMSPNDVMIDTLAELVVAFLGTANRTCCFTHILNLVVKVVLCQFDVPKSKADRVLDAASQALVDLAGDTESSEMEEAVMDNRGKDNENDDEEEVFDPRNGMSRKDQDELDSTVCPVRLVLVKVSSNSDQILFDELYSHPT
jgi:hypothetical protein